MERTETDVLVVGAGIAGLSAALAADRDGADVTLVTKAQRPEEASTWWAQGGIAITRDNPAQFEQDILDASAGTADPDAVDVLVDNAVTTVPRSRVLHGRHETSMRGWQSHGRSESRQQWPSGQRFGRYLDGIGGLLIVGESEI